MTIFRSQPLLIQLLMCVKWIIFRLRLLSLFYGLSVRELSWEESNFISKLCSKSDVRRT